MANTRTTEPGTPVHPKKKPYLTLGIGLVVVLLVGLLVFNATRSGPNYQEEQFTPDAPEQTS